MASKLLNKSIAILCVTTTLGIQSVQAVEPEALSLTGSVWGTFLISNPENDQVDYSKTTTTYDADLSIVAPLVKKDGFSGEAVISYEVSATDVLLDEAYLKLNHGMLTVTAGHIDVGGIDVGNAYATENGSSTSGDYGDVDGANDYFVFGLSPIEGLVVELGISARQGVVTDGNTPEEGNINVFDLVTTLEKGPFKAGFEYESISYAQGLDTSETIKDAESAYGVSFAYNIGGVTPFVNFGSSDSGVVNTELNIGADIEFASLGITAAVEILSDDVDGTDDVTNSYISVYHDFTPAGIAVSVFNTDAEGGIANELAIELSASF